MPAPMIATVSAPPPFMVLFPLWSATLAEPNRQDHAARTIGSMRLGSLFLTLPTRALTGQQIICSEGYGARSDLSWRGSAGSSPSHTGHTLGPSTTGIRL